MFTGIIQDIGIVTSAEQKGDLRLTITTQKLPLSGTLIGASIACSGICLTVIAKTHNSFDIQASAETISRTTIAKWKAGTKINLEPALRMGDELGGHLVTGHVDGLARLIFKQNDGESMRLRFEAPPSMSRFLAAKGSVALDGVSLTVNDVDGETFGVNIIPHTQAATTLGLLSVDDTVNFEVDMIARYAERLLQPK